MNATFTPHLGTILKIVRLGLTGDTEGVRRYAELLAEKVAEDGDERGAEMLREYAENDFGRQVLPMAVTVRRGKMKTGVKILRDIQLRPDGHVYTVRCSRVELDTKRKRDKKLHALIHQQGSHYGTVGDCCDYLTHAELLDLQQKGYVQIVGRIG